MTKTNTTKFNAPTNTEMLVLESVIQRGGRKVRRVTLSFNGAIWSIKGEEHAGDMWKLKGKDCFMSFEKTLANAVKFNDGDDDILPSPAKPKGKKKIIWDEKGMGRIGYDGHMGRVCYAIRREEFRGSKGHFYMYIPIWYAGHTVYGVAPAHKPVESEEAARDVCEVDARKRLAGDITD